MEREYPAPRPYYASTQPSEDEQRPVHREPLVGMEQRGIPARTGSSLERTPLRAVPDVLVPHQEQQSQRGELDHRRPPFSNQIGEAPSAREPLPATAIFYPQQGLGIGKERMLRGWSFLPNDQQLRAERDDCARRLQRFNSTVQAGNVHPETLHEYAQAIFQPHIQHYQHQVQHQQHAFPARTSPVDIGRLGRHVDIQAPFHCEYGYNICIADDVDIGAGCRILDSATVEIGSRTVLGPHVTIVTVDPEPVLPGPGMKRLFRAKRVIIGEDCYIGPSVTILPGARIASGSLVPPGSIVA